MQLRCEVEDCGVSSPTALGHNVEDSSWAEGDSLVNWDMKDRRIRCHGSSDRLNSLQFEIISRSCLSTMDRI